MASHSGKSDIRERLQEGFLSLEQLERDRRVSNDPTFGKAMELRILQRELLELELQEIDDELERICAASAELACFCMGERRDTEGHVQL